MKKTILLIILVLLLLFGISGLYMEFREYTDGEEEYSELEQYINIENENELIEQINDTLKNEMVLAPDEVSVDFSGLKRLNEDCVAWILIPNTNINYPVVEGIDNSYYVTHTFKKKSNKSGSIFLDMRNSSDFSDKNTIIYGHNLKNNKMFSDLRKYLSQSYFDSHKKIIIYTEGKQFIYEAFSVYKTMEDSEAYKVKFKDEETFLNHVDGSIEKSQIVFEGDKSNINNIITLSTCTNNKEGERVIVVEKLAETIDLVTQKTEE